MASHDGRTASFHNASGSASLRVLLQDDGGHQQFQCQSKVLSDQVPFVANRSNSCSPVRSVGGFRGLLGRWLG